MGEVDDYLGGRIGERTPRVTGVDRRAQLKVRGVAHGGTHRHTDLAFGAQNPDSQGVSVVGGICRTASISFEREFDFG